MIGLAHALRRRGLVNYCNEKLQQLFVDLTIGSEQQEYIIEVSRTVLCH